MELLFETGAIHESEAGRYREGFILYPFVVSLSPKQLFNRGRNRASYTNYCSRSVCTYYATALYDLFKKAVADPRILLCHTCLLEVYGHCLYSLVNTGLPFYQGWDHRPIWFYDFEF